MPGLNGTRNLRSIIAQQFKVLLLIFVGGQFPIGSSRLFQFRKKKSFDNNNIILLLYRTISNIKFNDFFLTFLLMPTVKIVDIVKQKRIRRDRNTKKLFFTKQEGKELQLTIEVTTKNNTQSSSLRFNFLQSLPKAVIPERTLFLHILREFTCSCCEYKHQKVHKPEVCGKFDDLYCALK